MKDFSVAERVQWIRDLMTESHTTKLVIGLSGGKDSGVALPLCVQAVGADNVIAITLPCSSDPSSVEHAQLVADTYGVKLHTVDLFTTFETLHNCIESNLSLQVSTMAEANIRPRLRMTTLYTVAQTCNALVVGTDNRSEMLMGYFTKWGDGAYDLNVLADLTVYEVLELGAQLGVPDVILNKAPSADLWANQTDEDEMGVTYRAIEEYLQTGSTDSESQVIIERAHRITQHKRQMPHTFKNNKPTNC